MNQKHKYPLAIAAVFIWIGCVCAISFMEAWLKFQAPGVTLSIGLSIGRLVFNMLNKVELFLAFVILVNLIAYRGFLEKRNIFYFIPVVIILIQTFFILPALDTRAQLHIDGQSVPPSKLHFYYVGMEVVKLFSLFVFGIQLLKNINKLYGSHKG